MSTHENLDIIAHTDLLHISGGRTDSGSGTVILPGGAGRVSGSSTTTNYESCLENNRRIAREKFPDNRWFWQRWRGDADPNAGPRADYEQQNVGRCTMP